MKFAFTTTLAASLRGGGLAFGLLLAACTQTAHVGQSANTTGGPVASMAPAPASIYIPGYQPLPGNTEKYQSYGDNPVKLTSAEALSTISLDVDTGSYSNVR
ncbi:MAG: von Willebrand factor type A domain-containing protein, partial [Azonexus sp.]|nr:von Willebrand factor type A domain-containing protein [Azonexus sp.]